MPREFARILARRQCRKRIGRLTQEVGAVEARSGKERLGGTALLCGQCEVCGLFEEGWQPGPIVLLDSLPPALADGLDEQTT